MENLEAKILKLANEGKSSAAIADELGLSRKTVSEVAQFSNIEVSSYRGRAKIELDTEELRNLYQNHNKTVKEIAETFGVSVATIRGRMKDAGITVKQGRPSVARDFDAEEVAELYVEKNMTLVEVAASLGVTINTVTKFLKQNNIPMRARGRVRKEPVQVIPQDIVEQTIALSDKDEESELEMVEMLSMKEMRELCTKHGLGIQGTRDELMERLVEYRDAQ